MLGRYLVPTEAEVDPRLLQSEGLTFHGRDLHGNHVAMWHMCKHTKGSSARLQAMKRYMVRWVTILLPCQRSNCQLDAHAWWWSVRGHASAWMAVCVVYMAVFGVCSHPSLFTTSPVVSYTSCVFAICQVFSLERFQTQHGYEADLCLLVDMKSSGTSRGVPRSLVPRCTCACLSIMLGSLGIPPFVFRYRSVRRFDSIHIFDVFFYTKLSSNL